jgi:hypothetical protein
MTKKFFLELFIPSTIESFEVSSRMIVPQLGITCEQACYLGADRRRYSLIPQAAADEFLVNI